MIAKLTNKQKANMDDCICPLPSGMHRKKASAKALIIPIVIFLIFLWIIWALSPVGALWIVGIFGVLAIFTMIWRLLRGHTIKCTLVWGPVAVLYTMGEGVVSVF